MTSVRFEPAALRSRVKQSTTEPLRSLHVLSYMAENRMEIDLNHTSFKIESKKTSLPLGKGVFYTVLGTGSLQTA